MTVAASRWAPPALAVAALLGTALAASAADHPRLTTARSFDVVAPRDGAKVGANFLLSWQEGGHASMRFAVLVDTTLPPALGAVVPGPTTLIVRGTAVRLTLGPRSGGSPSARHYHEIVVVPVDANDYRIGESAAVVHVRDDG